MKTCLFALLVAFCACASFAGEPTPAAPQSVLTAAPAAAEPIVAEPATACANGTCTTERSCRSSCRQGLFGRTIERTREVTRAVVEVPVQVVATPVRVFRARRGCCCR
jgi:hypothetical protein